MRLVKVSFPSSRLGEVVEIVQAAEPVDWINDSGSGAYEQAIENVVTQKKCQTLLDALQDRARALGLAPALVLQLGLFALLAAVTVLVERRRRGRLEERLSRASGWHRLRPLPRRSGGQAG